MIEAVFKYIYNYKKQIKDYIFVQLLVLLWICAYLKNGVYIEQFHILFVSRSIIFFFGILAIVVLVGYLLLLHKSRIRIREDMGEFIHLGMLPLSLILVFFSCGQNNVIVVIITMFLAVYAIILGLANIKKMTPRCVGKKKSCCHRLLYINRVIKMVNCIGFLIIINFFVCETVLPQKEAVTSVSITAEKTVISKEELVRNFDEKNWQGLSKEKKLKYLQKLADYTTQEYLGCCSVTVRQAIKSNKDAWGWFEDTMPECVFVSCNLLEEGAAYNLACTVLHEVYHHYEYECISVVNFNHTGSDLYYFKELKSWMENFEHYKEADKYGYEEYKNQPIEKDADAFAKRTIKKILGE